jgi:DNA-binding transcriptional ArsR family regulator
VAAQVLVKLGADLNRARQQVIQLLHGHPAEESVSGPATATSLAGRIGRSSGVTSYHLRMLAENGFIVEDVDRGNARDRFWRAPHRSMGFTLRMPDDPGSAENIGATEQYLRIVAEEIYRRILVGIEVFTSAPDDMATVPWTLNDWPLRLTVDQARELGRQISELAHRYRRPPGDPDPEPGTVRAYFQFQLLPDEPPPEGPQTPP